MQSRAAFSQVRNQDKPIANTSSSSVAPANLPGFQLRPTLSTGDVPTSVATGDFNGDGKVDMVVANGYDNNLWLYPGNGDGTFGTPSIIPLIQGLTPVAVAAADLRGNGKLDLIVADFDSWTISIFLGNGDGTFSYEHSYSTGLPATSVAVADFNGDGHLDVVAGLSTTERTPDGQFYDLAVFFGDGSGALSQPKLEKLRDLGSSPWNLVAADFNGDGYPDLISTDPSSGARLMLNDGQGNFTDAVANDLDILVPVTVFFAPAWTVVADLNGDGCMDAVTALLGTNNVVVNLGDCTGHFGSPQFYAVGATPQTVALADVNGDGILDIVTTSIAGEFPDSADSPSALSNDSPNLLSVAFGDGKGGFLAPHIYRHLGPSPGLATADFNGDGKADAVAVNSVYDTATVFLANGSGNFGDPQGVLWWAPSNTAFYEGSTFGAPMLQDLNGDGSRDVLIPFMSGDGFGLVSLLNDGTGHFGSPNIDIAGISLEQSGDFRAADFRKRGKPDLVVTGSSTATLAFIPNNGDGTFGAAVITTMPNATGPMEVGDFNGDGFPDIATSKQIFLGNGDGTFRAGAMLNYSDSSLVPAQIRVADVNKDGKLDVVMNDRTGGDVWVFLGNGDGTFQASQTQISGMNPGFPSPNPLEMADINNDGIPDFISYGNDDSFTVTPAALAAANVLYTALGTPSGTFSQPLSFISGYEGIPAQISAGSGPLNVYSTDAALGSNGLPDVLAFQFTPQPNDGSAPQYLSYAQILSNNGDGTFSPTNDIFNLSGAAVPQYAADLNGDGKANLLEIDGGNLSLHVMNGGAAPLFQIELAPGQFTGSTGSGWIYLNSPTAGGTVSLSTSATGIALPASVTIPAGQSSAKFTFSFGTGFNPLKTFDITAQMDGQIQVIYGSHTYLAGFSMQTSGQMQQTINQGQSTKPVTLTLTSVNGYSSTVTFSCPQVADQIVCTFNPATVTVPANGSASSTLTIFSSDSGYAQNDVLIKASDGIYAQYANFALQIDDLTISVISASPAFSPGTTYFFLLAGGVPPLSFSCSGLPAGTTCSFPSSGTMAIKVPAGLAVGTYPFTITLASNGATASTTASLVIQDFSIQQPDAADDWAAPGGTAYRTVDIDGVNGFGGSLAITCTTSWGYACTSGGTSVPIGSPDPTAFQVVVPAGAPTGTGTITFQVSTADGSTVHTATYPFVIANATGSISPTQLTFSSGRSGNTTVSLKASQGFDGSIQLTCDATPQLSCSSSPASVSLSGTSLTGTATVTIGPASTALNESSRLGARLRLVLLGGLPILFFTRRNRLMRAIFTAIALFGCFVLISSCGSGSSSGGTGGSGGSTSSSTYQVTVTGAIGQTNVSINVGTVTVVVN